MSSPVLNKHIELAQPALEIETLPALLCARAETHGQRKLYTFLSDDETPESSLTYAELEIRARAIGAWLQQNGAEGRRVLLLFPPGLDYIAAFFGCLYAGAVAVPSYPPRQNRNADRLLAILFDARPSLALTTGRIKLQLESQLAQVPNVPSILCQATDAIDNSWADHWQQPAIDGNSLAFLQYTSGSTSNPKGVMISHANLLHNERLIQRAFGQTEQSIIVGWLPLFHDMGLIGNVLQPLYVGAECILLSPMSFLRRPLTWLEAISRYRGTTSGAPNFAYDYCVRKVSPAERETLDLSSWTVAFNGSEPVYKETIDRFCAAFEGCGFRRQSFFPCYGLAEATLFVSGGPRLHKPSVKTFKRAGLEHDSVVPGARGDQDVRSLVSCGKVRKQRIRIVNPDSLTECAADKVGEIWVSGESIAQGYWGKPEASIQTFQAHLADTHEGPYLRTGDLGFIQDGQLFLTGRLKDLIIIRGRNCYPEDLEQAVARSDEALRLGEGAAFSIDVAGEERLVIVHEVAKTYRGDNFAGVVENMRQVLAVEHELQVFAVSLLKPGTLLKTSSGKVQRQALKKTFLKGGLQTVFEWTASESSDAPDATTDHQGATEWIVARVAAQLGIAPSQIDINKPVVYYGLDSLAAIELAQSIELNLHVSLPPATLLQEMTIAEIAAQVEIAPIASTSQLSLAQSPATFPLSHGQGALWFLHRLAPQSAAYNVTGTAKIRGDVDVPALRDAFQKLIERHPQLRARFSSHSGYPVQIIQELPVSFHEENLCGWSDETTRRRITDEAHRPFDLENGPVFRVRLFKVADDEHVLLVAAHHIVVDLWSLAVLLKELGALCEARELPVAEWSYESYVRSQEQLLGSDRGAQLWEYWRQQLSGELPVLSLPADFARPAVQTFEGASESLEIDRETTAKLQSLARENLTTLYTVLLAAYTLLLQRHTGQQELIVGSPTSGRTDRRFQAVVGYFVNPVPLRVQLDPRETFSQLLAHVRKTVLTAFEHQDYPFALLVDRLCRDREPGRSPVFQTTFVYDQAPPFSDASLASFVAGEAGARLSLGAMELEAIRLDQEIAQFDISMNVTPAQRGLRIELQYNKDLFKAATAARMLERFKLLLGEIIANPDQKLSEIPLLTAAEERRLLIEFNDTHREYPRGNYLHEMFEACAARAPRVAALEYEAGVLSYGELNARANQLAHYLRELGVKPEVRVAILLERSPEMIAVMLAVLKAGGAYVPLDPAYPADRLAFMIEDAEASVVISRSELSTQLPAHSARLVMLDVDEKAITAQNDQNPRVTLEPENLSHIIYTSGSTGRPKGVAISHGNVINFLHWTLDTFSSAELAGVFASTSICFDLSVFEIFGPLSCGGTVILAGDALHLSTHNAAANVTLINTVPSAMAELLRVKAVGPSVRTINLAGEALQNKLAQQLFSDAAAARGLNLYGPTEYTTYTTMHELQRGTDRQPLIGRAIANTQVYVLDESTRPAPIGVVGEICIGGEGLARGYWQRTSLTAERFVPDHLSGKAGARLYRTGDLGRYLDNGEIEYLGRIDHQVKLRGYRIELGEIESALLHYPGIKEAAVVAREDSSGDKQLVAYIVNDAGGVAVNGHLHDYLRSTLPAYMVPQVVMTLPAMPLTRNGKIDRRSLPQPDRNALSRETVKVSAPLEEVVANTWSQVLEVDRIGRTDNFFEIGGQSLKAVQVVSRLSELFNVKLPVRAVFEAPTVAALAKLVEQEVTLERDPRPALKRVSRGGPLPASFAQQRLWFLQRLAPKSAAYNVSFSAHCEGPLNVAALEQSVNEIVRRHEALRTTFAEVGGTPVQIIAPQLTLKLVLIDLSQLSETVRNQQVQRLMAEVARSPFDLEAGPLVRVSLFRLSAQESVLCLDMHHIISDGWSAGVFVRELMAHYDAFTTGTHSPLPDLAFQYADLAAWQNEFDLETQLAFWRKQLSGPAPALELPSDRPRPAIRNDEGATLAFDLPAELVGKLKALGRSEGATLFMTLLAGFQLLLSRHSAQTDISVGTPIANRVSAEAEPLIGCFINTLVMRTDLSEDPSFRQLLHRVREVALGAYTHPDVPFERLVTELQPERDLSRTPLFQVMLVLQNTPLETLELGGLRLQPRETDNGTSKFDMTLQFTEVDGALAGRWEYSTDLFDVETIERMASRLEMLFESIVEEPDRRISEVSILTNLERAQLAAFNNTNEDYPATAYLHELFEEQVKQNPNAVALTYEDGSLSYHELNERANRLAHYLSTLGVGPEVCVGLLLDRSPQLIVSMLAVLKAGGAYLPLDLAYPGERISFMLADTRASVLITKRELLEKFPEYTGTVLDVDEHADTIAQQSSENPRISLTPENLSHVIYTSGSTGVPKGVAIEHRCVTNFLHWATRSFAANELSAVFASTSICFDLSVFEIFAPLSCGGAVILAKDALHLADHPAAQQVTLLNTVPSAMAELLRLKAVGPQVQTINLAGEPLKQSLAQETYSQTNVSSLRNLYGPTEYTTYTTSITVNRDSTRPPTIGRPLANTRVYILDQGLQLAPIGVVGELYINGSGLVRGYLNRPALTAERFVPDKFSGEAGARLYRTGDLGKYLPNGEIEYLGRDDHQVKIRGFRIELGEIESALEQLDGVQEAVVIAGVDQRLVAYVVGTATADDLRRSLRVRLPDYMIPATFVSMEQLPLTPNGKVDRRALPVPSSPGSSEEAVEPRTMTEQLLTQIWLDVLKLERVGVHDNFFEHGGHSLLATQVVARARETFHVELPVRSVFEAPTIAGLAEALDRAASVEIEPIRPTLSKASLPLSFAQQRLWFLAQLQPNSTAYNLSMAVRVEGPIDYSALERSFDEVIRRHEILRTRFCANAEGEPQQVITPHKDFKLPLTDLMQLPNGQREKQARQLFAKASQYPFNLATDNLLRVNLLRLKEEEHWLLLVTHHIIGDAWSIGIFNQELASLYNAFIRGGSSPLPELTLQYADYATWQKEWLTEERVAHQLDYWRRQLSGAPAVLELPTDHPRPAVQTFRGADIKFSLSNQLTADVNTLCRRHALTPFMVLETAFALLLHRYSRQLDISVGTPVAARTRLETESLIGPFLNTLVLRTKFDPNQSVNELLSQVRETTLQAHAHQDLPFDQLVDELVPERNISFSPLCQAMFVLHNTPSTRLDLSGLKVSDLDREPDAAQFDCLLRMEERDSVFAGRFNYNVDLFSQQTAERMVRHFQQLLDELVQNPEQKVGALEMLSAAEREQLLVEWNDTKTAYPVDECLHELFEAQVARTPDGVAVSFGETTLTYSELDQRANQLAHLLRRKGVGPDVLVGVMAERSLEMVVALVGILKAGGAYVPLDPNYPAERLSFMLEDSSVPVLLAQRQFAELSALLKAEVIYLEDLADLPAADIEKPAELASGDNASYIIYTSGSTGRPKAIINTHTGICNRLRWMIDTFDLTPEDRVLQKTTFSFDVAVWEFFWPLITGARLVMARPHLQYDAAGLIDTIVQERITNMHFVPSMLAAFLNQPDVERCTTLKRVYCSGETLPASVQKLFFERLPAELYNMYGPAEAAVEVTWWACRRGTDPHLVPIGRPMSNTQIYLLDEWLHVVPPGVPGELYIGGANLARSYLSRPGLTAERFIPNPFSTEPGARIYKTGDLARYQTTGDIDCLGRTDHQVKIRGMRVEPGEIESVLTDYPGVVSAAVIAKEDESGRKFLVGYVAGDAELKIDDVRTHLRARLPEHMVPAILMQLGEIHLTPTGKIDRRSLPEPVRTMDEEEFVPPTTDVEQKLAEIWKEVLGVPRVGLNDNFFTLGGDSILTIHISARARQAGLHLTPRQFFQQQTLGQLALVAEAIVPAAEPAPEPELPAARNEAIIDLLAPAERENVEDVYPLTPFQQGMLFHVLHAPDAGIYLSQQRYTLQGPLDVPAFQKAFQAVVNRHQILRTAFLLSPHGDPVQVVYRQVDLSWVEHDWRGNSTTEQSRRMETLLRSDYELKFDLARPPLMRMTIVQKEDELYEFIWSLHLMVMDGSSGPVVLKELLALYRNFRGEQQIELEPPVRYSDYISWLQQQQSRDEAAPFWRNALAGFVRPTSLGFDRESVNGSAEHSGYGERSLQLDRATTSTLRSFTVRHKLTLNTLVQGAWAALLSRRSASDDVVFGSVVAGRPADFPGVESAVGPFLNALPVRVRVPVDGQVVPWLATIQTQQVDVRRFEYCSLVDIQGWSDVPRGRPLFESVVIFQNIPLNIAMSEVVGLKVIDIKLSERSNLPLTLVVEPGAELIFRMIYQRSRFDDSTIERMLENLRSWFAAVAADPEPTFGSLSAHAGAQRSALINSFNQSLEVH